MARAEYVKHVNGTKLKKGDVLVFRDYYTVLGSKAGYVTRTDPLSGETTREKVKFRVERFNRDGSGKVTAVEEFRLHMEFPTGRLTRD